MNETLQAVIETIEEWDSKTPAELLTELTEIQRIVLPGHGACEFQRWPYPISPQKVEEAQMGMLKMNLEAVL